MKILVYCENPSPRFRYIANYFLGTLCGLEPVISTDISELKTNEGASICYHETRLSPKTIHVKPSGLLFQEGVSQQALEAGTWKGLTTFFQTEGDLPFDLFAAAFYLLSRYEEYLPHEQDLYGRFAHTNSVAHRFNFLHRPLIDQWAYEFRQMVAPDLLQGRRKFRFIPTYDIDMAWAYKHKGFRRNFGNLMRELAGGNWQQVSRRLGVLRGRQQDPFDIYEWLDALHLRFSLKPVYFFLVARDNSEYDKNILPHKAPMRELISYHASGYKVGIHPSWRSSLREDLLEEELGTLTDILGFPVVRNRFHYLAFRVPLHYRRLISLGIADDYSMGYGTINGYRASVSEPFPWYDLEREKETSLTVHPFCWMDANSYYEQGYTPARAFEELKGYHDELKRLGGQLITISHNNFLSDEPGFAGWKQVYEIFLDEVVYWDL